VARSPTPGHGSPADDAWIPRAGAVLSGKYAVQRLIGKGGMAAVVAARQVALGGDVAIKILHPRLANDEEGSERFFREARATARIRSEHVVRVLDVGTTEGGLPYIVMELLHGRDLGQLLDSGALSVHHAVDFVLQASEALAEAHALGIVHRDLKPSNLWLSQRPDGTPFVKVLDFGISKLSAEVENDPKLTETQSVFGSPMYMSPEQIRSAKRVDPRTDVWALGVVLYELLAGRLPFEADTAASALASITADDPAPLHPLRPEVPPELEQAIYHCLVKDVTKRCQSLAELARLLVPFASPLGRLSAERISRIGEPAPALFPALTSSRALGDARPTETAFSGLRTSSRSGSPMIGIGIGVAVALFIVALVLFGMRLGAQSSTQATAASGEPKPAPLVAASLSASPSAPLPVPPVVAAVVADAGLTFENVPPPPGSMAPSSSSTNRPKLTKPIHGYAHDRH